MDKLVEGKMISRENIERDFKPFEEFSERDWEALVLEELLKCDFEGVPFASWDSFITDLTPETEPEMHQWREPLLDAIVRLLGNILTDEGGVLRIVLNKFVLQEAMDRAGVWYQGFQPSEGTRYVQAGPELIRLMKETGGDFEKVVEIASDHINASLSGQNPPKDKNN